MDSYRIPDLETEVLVIGAGGAGLAAAVAACEKGAKVIVLEKRGVPGGNAVWAWGFFAADSKSQKKLGIEASRDAFFKMQMEYTHWRINPRIVRAFIHKSGDTIQWLEDKGVVIDDVPLYYPDQPIPTYHISHDKDSVGRLITRALVKDLEGAGAQIMYHSAAKQLLTDESGQLTGVVVSTKGQEFKINARSVIICTGGYAGNKKLLKKHCSRYTEDMYNFGLPLTGDGLLMATKIGVATEGLGMMLVSAPTIGRNSRKLRHLACVTSEPNTLWVNKRGERFVDETITFVRHAAANPVMRQPDSVSYTLFDDKIVQEAIEKGPVTAGLRYTAPTTPLTKLRKEIQIAADIKENIVKISDSWDEIAGWMGASPEVIKATVDEYNSSCDKGYDDIFVKEKKYLQALRTPPYYAVKCHPSFSTTIGGIKIDHHMQVLGKNDEPVHGLYATGDAAGGWEHDTYNLEVSGFPYGFAVNSGRIAGESAANYVSGE
ncbi:FAD-dependent oxidoreductase [Chloroflexota bacterium]